MPNGDQPSAPVMREINLSAEMIKMMGKEYTAPEVEYEFSNGRQFKRTLDDYYRLYSQS